MRPSRHARALCARALLWYSTRGTLGAGRAAAEDANEHQKKDGKGGRKVENVSVSAASKKPTDQTITCNYTKQEERDTAIAIDSEVDGVDEAEEYSNQNVVIEEVKDDNDDSVDENVGADVDDQAHLEVSCGYQQAYQPCASLSLTSYLYMHTNTIANKR